MTDFIKTFHNPENPEKKVFFDPDTKSFHNIEDTGARPSPRAAFGYAQSEGKGFLFVGWFLFSPEP